MLSLQSILAATDFSTDAENASERAALICQELGVSRGVMLHVFESSWLDSLKHLVSVSADIDQSVLAEAAQQLNALAAAIRESTGFALEHQVLAGRVLDTILQVSEDFDLLVLGARGKHPLRDFAIGTTAERLLRQTRKPLLVVKRKAAGPYRKVLVAVDFSPHSHKAFAYSHAVAPEAEIHLAHVFEVPFERKMRYAGVSKEIIDEYRTRARLEAEAAMTRFIEESGSDGLRLHRSVAHGSHVSTELRNKVDEMGADLVVVGRHGKSLAEHLLLGSVTLHLLAECACDILVTQ